MAAAERGDHERFHDLAWRAVQKGPKNDPGLMTMLARAQSLSGRPHDALVMLQRLAALGVRTEAAEHEDFRRVRGLAGWPALQARLEELTAAPAVAAPSGSKASPPATPKPEPSRPRPDTPPAAAPRGDPKPAEEPARGEATEALRFPGESFTPAGLAYDAVSNRFIVADRGEKKLMVIGERSQRTSNLIGAESGGFGEIGGIAIDVRQGDLWVASTSSEEKVGARLHKLQLISGRHLFTVAVNPDERPARFVDVAIAADGSVLALDGSGRRIFRYRATLARDGDLERAAELDVTSPLSLAPAQNGILFVAHAGGLSRIDLQSHTTTPIKPSKGVNLTGLSWVRWHRDRIIGVQRSGEGHQIVRIRLDRNRTATRLDVLERDASVLEGATVTIAGNTLYYLTSDRKHSTPLYIVRRLEIK